MIYKNNQSVIVLIKNFQFHARIKHIDIQNHFIREKIIEELIDLIYMFIDQMITDDLTKSLIRNKFVQFRDALEIKLLFSQQNVFTTAICESLSIFTSSFTHSRQWSVRVK
jgi:parvulin-like peptidyl-prolyl isomerase